MQFEQLVSYIYMCVCVMSKIFFSRPPQETLSEYQKKVDLLKGLIAVEKMVSFLKGL